MLGIIPLETIHAHVQSFDTRDHRAHLWYLTNSGIRSTDNFLPNLSMQYTIPAENERRVSMTHVIHLDHY